MIKPRWKRCAEPLESAQHALFLGSLFYLWIPEDLEHLLIPAATSSSFRREPMRRPNLDAACVWDLVLSSGGVRGSGVMRRGGQTLCVVFLLSVMLQPAAKKPCSYDIIPNVQTLITDASQQVGPLASLTRVRYVPDLRLHPDQVILGNCSGCVSRQQPETAGNVIETC